MNFCTEYCVHNNCGKCMNNGICPYINYAEEDSDDPDP